MLPVLLLLAQAPATTPTVEATRAWLARECESRGLPGLSAAIVREAEVVLALGVGLASIEEGRPATAETVYPLYSLTKVFTGVAVLRLVQDGRLALDQPLGEGLPAELAGVTLRQALGHTSGLRNFFEAPEWSELAPEERARLTARDVLEVVAGLAPRSAPGAEFAYAQSGYVLSGWLVERAAGRPFAEVVRGLVLDPAGMTGAVHGPLGLAAERAATIYAFENGERRLHALDFEPFVYPAAGLNASARDLASFAVALHEGRVLPREALEEAGRASALAGGRTSAYGLGWALEEIEGLRRAGHEGGGAAWFWHVPDRHLSVAVLTNRSGARCDDLVDALLRRYL